MKLFSIENEKAYIVSSPDMHKIGTIDKFNNVILNLYKMLTDLTNG